MSIQIIIAQFIELSQRKFPYNHSTGQETEHLLAFQRPLLIPPSNPLTFSPSKGNCY